MSHSDEDDMAGKRLLGSIEDELLVFPQNHAKRFLLVVLVVFGYFFAYGISIPIISFYVFDKTSAFYAHNISSSSPCGNETTNSTVEKLIQKEVAETYLILTLVWLLPSVFPLVFLGPSIDRTGRKKGLLVPMAGSMIKQIILIVVVKCSLPVNYIIIGQFVEGICGGFGTVLMAAFAMVADLTPQGKTRTLRITIIEATNAIGVSLSIISIGFWLQKHHSYTSPSYLHSMILAIVLASATFTVTWFFVSETLQQTVTSSWCASVKNIRKCFTFYVYDTYERRRWKILVGISVFILTLSVNFSHDEIVGLYLMRRPLCWDELKVTAFQSITIIASSFTSIVVLKVVQGLLNLKDSYVAIAGCISSMFGMVILAFARSDWVVYASAVAALLLRVVSPMTRSVMSHSVRQDEQGALFAGMACIEVTFPVIISALSTLLYRATVQLLIGVVFLVLAGIMFIVLSLFIFLNIRISRQPPHRYEAIN